MTAENDDRFDMSAALTVSEVIAQLSQMDPAAPVAVIFDINADREATRPAGGVITDVAPRFEGCALIYGA